MEMHPVPAPIADALARRGLSVHRHNPARELLFGDLEEASLEALYREMKRYSVRLFFRDVISHRDGFTADMLGEFTGRDERERMIRRFVELGILDGGSDGYRLARGPVRSFGGTLEWFVARMMEQEFASPSIWGVTFRDAPAGGDYDVLSFFEGELIYIEVKSSPPKGIEMTEAGAFLERVNTLLPRAAFFFVDTQLRMRDRVVLLFHQRFLEILGDPYPSRPDLRHLEGEIFHIDHRIFILNAGRDIVKNFKLCLRNFLGRGLSVF
jgi:hypothetical protein